jgi:hypothetical protein
VSDTPKQYRKKPVVITAILLLYWVYLAFMYPVIVLQLVGFCTVGFLLGAVIKKINENVFVPTSTQTEEETEDTQSAHVLRG